MDRIQKLADNYTGLQGFLVFNVVGSLSLMLLAEVLVLGLDLLERISVDYRNKSKLGFTISPDLYLCG